MIFNYLIPSIVLFIFSSLYLKLKPSMKLMRWIRVLSGAISTILIMPLILFMAIFAWEALISNPIERRQFEKDYDEAEEIVDGIEKFYANNEYYPAELTDLVPIYLSRLPPEPHIERYLYQLREDEEFMFTFYAHSRVGFNMHCSSQGSDMKCSFFDD